MTTNTTKPQAPAADLALRYLAGGISLVPCSHRTKRPDNDLLPRVQDPDQPDRFKPSWKPWQTTPPDEATVQTWFKRGCKTVAAIGGTVSGGLLIVDFDVSGFYERWCEAVGELANGLPVQRTGGGGYQVALRCPEPGENQKLAWEPNDTEDAGREIAIETRAEGGYAVLPGSLHPSGRFYEAIAGDWTDIPKVSQARADALLAAARKLDRAPFTRQEMEQREAAAKESKKHHRESNGQGSVIDAFNAARTIDETLLQYGYTRIGQPPPAWLEPNPYRTRPLPSIEPRKERLMATKDGVAEALCQIGISPNVPDSNLEPANLVDALARIGDAIHHGLKYLGNADASTPMGALEAHGKAIIDAGESIAGSVTAVADAIDRHADAVNELARALHMDPLSHAICTGIRHGLFGAEAQSDETIHAGLYDVAQALREGQVQ